MGLDVFTFTYQAAHYVWVFLPTTVSIMEFELFFPVTELWALQMYSPLIFKDKGPVVSIEVLATSELLNHQVK